jgi:hypothetical protein
MTDDKPKPADLDLIRMVQQARIMHDREAVPSNISAVYWIESKPLTPMPDLTPRAGQWLIESSAAEVDDLWVKIREATEAGRLGYKSKVSTTAAKGQSQASARLIIVRTYDADDSADVLRIQTVLREIGVTTLSYERIAEN